MPADFLLKTLADQAHSASARARCYWSILALPPQTQQDSHTELQANIDALEIIYVDPLLQAHLGPQAGDILTGQPFFQFVHSQDKPYAKQDMADLLGPARTTFGSVVRCRFATASSMRTKLNQKTESPLKARRTRATKQIDEQGPEDAINYPVVDLVVSYIGEGLALCFMHNIMDESPQDHDESHRTSWSNWCGVQPGSFTEAPEHIFQIIRSANNGSDILFSWPPPRLFPKLETTDNIASAQAASVVVNSPMAFYEDGSYFADDFASLAQGLNPSLFALSDASTTCTRRLRAKHTLTTDGLIRSIESVVIGYGDIIIAFFTNVSQERIAQIPTAPASRSHSINVPSVVPTPSQLQTGEANADLAAALEAQSQVALMSQSSTNLSPIFLQQTLSPKQAVFDLNGLGLLPTVFDEVTPQSAPAHILDFAEVKANPSFQPTTETAAAALRRSSDGSHLAPHSRSHTFDPSGSPEDRRMSTGDVHQRANSFNSSILSSTAAMSQYQQLMLDSEIDSAAAGRYRMDSYASFATAVNDTAYNGAWPSNGRQNSMASSSDTMCSPRQGFKWGSISAASAAPTHHDSLVSCSGATTALDAAALAAASAAATAASSKRRSRQETWPLARIEDEANAAPQHDSAAALAAALAAGVPLPSSERSRSFSAVVNHTDPSRLSVQTGGLNTTSSSNRLMSSTGPLDPSSAAATAAAAAAAVAAAASSASVTGSNDASAVSAFAYGVSGNSINASAAGSVSAAPTFSFGASPDIRPTIELPTIENPFGKNQGQTSSQPCQSQVELHSTGSPVVPLKTEHFDNAGPFVSTFGAHARATSAPGLALMGGIPQSQSQQLGAVLPQTSISYGYAPPAPKRCASCGTANSPEWRRGPTGHKTLCNACGLRYSRSVSRAKKRDEKRKASENLLRRSSEAATAATTAAAVSSAAVAAAAAVAQSKKKLAKSSPIEISRDAFVQDDEDMFTAGPTAQPMAGVVSTDGQSPPSFLIQPDGPDLSGTGATANLESGNMLGLEPPFLCSRASGSSATSISSAASSFYGGSFGIPVPGATEIPMFLGIDDAQGSSIRGSSASSLNTVSSSASHSFDKNNNNSSSNNKNGAEDETMQLGNMLQQSNHLFSMNVGMERANTADWALSTLSNLTSNEANEIEIAV
ncbi:hypothetical protein OC846_001599 [Tilletia horrida]|uniref:GATA-type domain-containing protein n=1 Tax=Tilletia horrida TaxID=155126 RepID=A0AAN6GT12_9BASI|nr:hypothetical protein OC846_001599 [Tilletia horrida]KAK0569504.1 hypothetical protein OC861_000877 [Tilletia horrida]